MVFQVVGSKLTLNRLKSYSERKPLDLKYEKSCFADRTIIEDLADGTA